MQEDLPIILFETKSDWTDWLALNQQSVGIWVRMARKKTGIKSIYYEDALEVALCYGWIDGVRRKYDENTFIQRFTPRRPKSLWSKINKNKAVQLIKEGKMTPSGLAAIKIAKKNGMWENAYDSQSSISIPDDFQAELSKNKEAEQFFKKLNSINRYAILHRIQKTKTEFQRNGLIQKFISMLEENKKLY